MPDTQGLLNKIYDEANRALRTTAPGGTYEAVGNSGTAGVTTTVYVATTGNDTTGTGASGAPYLTLQKAFDHIAAKAGTGVLVGTWVIDMAAGTHAYAAAALRSVPSVNRIQIVGKESAGTPTVIIDGASVADRTGLELTNVYAYVENVKFINFTGTNGNAMLVQYFANVHTKNVHCDNCGFAGINVTQARLYEESGYFEDCRYGIRGYSAAVLTIGYNATSLATGSGFLNCTEAGVHGRDASNLHVDYATIDACVRGVYLQNNARAHVLGSDIKNNTTAGVRAETGSRWLNDLSTANTFTSNGENWQMVSFSTEDGLQASGANPPLRPWLDLTTVSHTGDLTEPDLKTWTLADDRLIKLGQRLTLRAWGTFAGTAGTKTVRLRLGVGAGITQAFTSSATTTDWWVEWAIYPSAAASQRIVGRWLDGTVSRFDASITSNDLSTGARVLRITGQLANAADTISCEGFEVEMVD